MSLGPKKPRLSGAQRRKIVKEKAIAVAAITGEYIPPPPTLGNLETVRDYRRELNTVYRRMRAGHMPPETATKSAFILNLGAALAKAEQELRELTQLREQIERLQGGGPAAVEYAGSQDHAGDQANGHGTTDFLPASRDEAPQ